ncbi:MAG: Gfo/Idh/MocA family oxidoreductase [candidate division FCPU426 bacterium]
MQKKTKVGIVGCGNISEIYFKAGTTFENLEIIACSDLNAELSAAKAKQFGAKAMDTAALLADKDVEIVINLTVPSVHAEVSTAALNAGKHVYSEKPLALKVSDGKALVALAAAKGLRLGCAPDTFLGAGLQTCRKLLDDGWIGKPLGATAFMMGHGMETWHPNPEFFYQPGGGPMFDMGPYYLTALVNMLGPVGRIAAIAKAGYEERLITSQPRFGQKIKVNTPTHVAGLLEFAGGAVGTLVTSFDVWHSSLPPIEIYGTEGTLAVPDPNSFGNTVSVRRAGDPEWKSIPFSHGYTENSRGLGVADMASAIQNGRPHRANGDMALHVLECMQSFLESSASGGHKTMETKCQRPAPLPLGLRNGTVD